MTGFLADLGATLGAIPTVTPTYRESAATSLTPESTDAFGGIGFTSSSSVTVTIPTNASVAFPVWTTLTFVQRGSGQVTVSGDVGVTVRKPATKNAKTTEQNSPVTVLKLSTDEWLLYGDLETP